ncbi:hypothetical protein ACFVP3_35900 [Streptomyces sp. NPDC057806]|uniref:hypothetical protein n=1 Tax=Streptomyces sp. NPDC057806 TaxID=3346255 RepID=UPI0036BC571E
MSSGHKTMTLFVTVILGLILVIVGLCSDWPLWAWPTAAALLLVTGAVTHRVLTPRREAFPRELTPEPDLPLPEPLRQEQRITHVALPSAVSDYDFSFSATVRWLLLDAPGDAPYVNPAGLAVDAVLRRARAVTVEQPPTQCALVQHQLEGALATMRTDPGGRVMAMALDVSLNLPEPDRERLSKLSNVRKDEDVWEHERRYERSKRAYLGEDVLKDTGSAVVWWLSRNEEKVEGAVDRIGLLAQLSAAANNERVAQPFDHLVTVPRETPAHGTADGPGARAWQEPSGLGPPISGTGADVDGSLDSLLTWFGFAADDPDVHLFAQRLLTLAVAHGKSGAADEIKHRFGLHEGERTADGADGGSPSGPDESPA